MAMISFAPASVESAASVATAPEERNTFLVPEERMDQFRAGMMRLARKAAKQGFTSPSFTVAPNMVKKEVHRQMISSAGADRVHCIFMCYQVTIENPAFRVGNYEFVATLEHLGEEGTLIHAIGDQNVPEKYRHTGPVCEHCGYNRKRNETFLLLDHESNEYRQIGRNCVEDYVGQDARLIGAAFEATMQAITLGSACSDLDPIGMGNEFGAPRYELLSAFMPLAAQIVLDYGYVSRMQADKTGVQATADRVRDARIKGLKNRVAPIEQVEALAKAAIEWACNISDQEVEGNDYMHNLRTMAQNDVVSNRHVGRAASIIPMYQRAIAPKFGEGSKHVGAVGEKLTVAVTVHRSFEVRGFSNGYVQTPTFLHIMVDESGNVMTWKASGTKLDAGESYVLRGTVKRHDEYKGVLQTVLTRCSEVSYRQWIVSYKGQDHEVKAEDEKEAKENFKSKMGLARLPKGITVKAL